MTYEEQLKELRKDIDAIDKPLMDLFEKRMEIVQKVGDIKMQGNLSIGDPARERQIVKAAVERAGGIVSRSEIAMFMQTLISISKLRQNTNLLPENEISLPASGEWKENPAVAYQGVPGSWGEQSAAALFEKGALTECKYFEDVFEAVRSGVADYGVLPIENSLTGAIGEVYDLLRKYNCFIVRQTWTGIRQNLVAKPGTKISDIREVVSHPQGFKQCSRFLKDRSWDFTECRNTAVAARIVAEREDSRVAAIASGRAASLYGLDVLAPDIMDTAHNRTRFIAIATQPIYDESCNDVSVSFSTVHTSGALCTVLQSFMLSELNMTRIESRPVSEDRYRFFVDLKANLMQNGTMDALRQASMHCEYFEILGCYGTVNER